MATAGLQMFLNGLNRRLEPPVKSHLKQVYGTMSLALLAAALGAYVHLFTNLLSGGLLSGLASLGFGLALYSTPDHAKSRDKRMAYLMGFAACSGLSTGPLLDFALLMNPAIVPTALISTSLIFICFTISTMFADQRKYLFLGGTLMSLLSSLLLVSLVNIFIRSSFLYNVYLYGGLCVMCAFICYDTAAIIEKRRMGDEDYIGHALLLFIDFIDVFRHLLVILSRREAEKDRRKRRD